jgi:DNA-binding GntR family transcriptional regulator
MYGHNVKRFVIIFLKIFEGARSMSNSLYLRVARDLTEGIASGRYPVGTLLPTEMQLSEHYGTSRHTVRAAIRELQELGLVSRRKKAGTRVEASSPSGGYRQSLATIEELSQFGATHKRVVRRVENIVADRALSKEISCPPGTRWLRISSLRLKDSPDNPPVGWTDVYVDADYSEVADIVRGSPETLISSLIEKRYGRRISAIQQDIQAVLVPAALSDELQVSASTPALKIIRRYIDTGGRAVEISVTIHPAERFVFSTLLSRKQS